MSEFIWFVIGINVGAALEMFWRVLSNVLRDEVCRSFNWRETPGNTTEVGDE